MAEQLTDYCLSPTAIAQLQSIITRFNLKVVARKCSEMSKYKHNSVGVLRNKLIENLHKISLTGTVDDVLAKIVRAKIYTSRGAFTLVKA